MHHSRPGHNCHGVAVDVFMTYASRLRWEEVRDVWPDDDKPPAMDIQRVDNSWIEKRTLENLTREEKKALRRPERDWKAAAHQIAKWRTYEAGRKKLNRIFGIADL